MYFRVLGPLTVTENGEVLRLGGPKQRTVLALLIAGAGSQVSLETIVDAVWGEEPISNARRNVQTYIATLRSILGDVIVKDSFGWRLDLEPDQIDAVAFVEAYEAARTVIEQQPEQAATILRDALAQWQGHPYADIEAHGALDAEIVRLSELRITAQTARLDADLAAGRAGDLIGEIEAMLGEHPYSEQFRAQHMLALYRSGRQQEALRSYRDLQTALLDELGVEPTHELRDLELQILRQDPSLQSPRRPTVTRRAVVVVDLGDPIEMRHLPSDERATLLDRLNRAIGHALIDDTTTEVIAAGATTYLIAESAARAAEVAENLSQRTPEPRLGIDWGEVVLKDGRVEGAPVSRAASLAAVGHNGQILLSADAQQAIGADSAGNNPRFEARGSHLLHGMEAETLIYELLVAGRDVFPGLHTDRMPPPLPRDVNRSVPGYELREPFGPGSIGTLHRAFQPSVGREVLVEAIGQATASEPRFIRDFESDALRLALLDHRHLTPVLDFWRDPEGAYLVYQYPRGGNLDDLSAVDGEKVLGDVASALAYAHSVGMVHGSLRPDRVLLDEAGNASVIGFPIAGRSDQRSVNYPAYIAPETLRGEGATVAADIYALAVLAHELQSGPVSPDAPITPGNRVLAQALSVDPADRPATVAELIEALTQGDDDADRDRFTPVRNPYKGLAAFHELDAGDFFGRTAAVDELVDQLGDSSLIAIVGPSGVGKSSVARAGLIPALRSGRIPGSDLWVVSEMLPGNHPFLALRRAIERVAIRTPLPVAEALAAWQPAALDDIELFLPEGSPLLLLIDQFEELFTLTAEEEREAFLNLIGSVVRTGAVRVVLTLRADFLDQPLSYSEFGELLRGRLITLRTPTVDELADAVREPAATVGVTIEPDVVHRVISEVHDQPGALPLLQHAVVELFEARTSDTIDEETFSAIGGVQGSLARRAEAIHDALDARQRTAIRQVFLRMVTINDDGPLTRRRVRLTDIAHLQATEAVQQFSKARMLVHDNDRETRSPTIEVAHEALLSHWPRLAGWIDGAREELRLARRLDEAAREWAANDRQEGFLLAGRQLDQHRAWTSDANLHLTDNEAAFLSASLQQDTKVRANAKRRRRLTLTSFAAAAVVALLLAAVALQNANRAVENERAADAEALAANAIASQQTDPTLSLLLGLEAYRRSPSVASVSALHQGLQADRQIMAIPPPGESFGAAGAVDPTGRRVAVVGYLTSIVQLWDIGGSEPIWEKTLTEDSSAGLLPTGAFWFSEDGTMIYVPISILVEDAPSGPGVGMYTLDAETGETLDFWRWSCLARGTPAGADYVRDDDPFLLGWVEDWSEEPGEDCLGDLRMTMVNVSTREILHEEEKGSFGPPSASRDGRVIARSGPFPAEGREAMITEVLSTESGETLLELVGAGLATLSDDGAQLLAGANPTYLFDVDTGERLAAYQGDINRVFFSPSGDEVVGSGASGIIRLFAADSGTELLSLRGHTSQVRGTSIDLAERILVSSGFDAARVWDIAELTRGDLPSLPVTPFDENRFPADALSTNGDLALVHRGLLSPGDAPRPHRVDVIDVVSHETIRSYEVLSAVLGPNGVLVMQPVIEQPVTSPSGAADAALIGAPVLVDAATGEQVQALEACGFHWITELGLATEATGECVSEEPLEYLYWEFSPDGQSVLATNELGAVGVWDVPSGALRYHRDPVQLVPNRANQGLRFGASFSPDGERVLLPPSSEDLADGSAPVTSIDLRTGEQAEVFELDKWTNFMAPDGNGNIIAAGDSLHIVDTDDWSVTSLRQTQAARIDDLALSPDGRLAATVGPDDSLSVWNLTERSLISEITILGDTGQGLRGVAFADENTILVVPEQGDGILRFIIDEAELADLAAQRLTRGFLIEECATYDIDPCPTLDELRAVER